MDGSADVDGSQSNTHIEPIRPHAAVIDQRDEQRMPKDREPITEHSASARPRIRAWQSACERETYALPRGEIDHAIFFILIREEAIGDDRHV